MALKKLVLAAVFVVIALLAYFSLSGKAPSNAHFDDSSPVMYFYTDYCQWCLKEKPLLEELSKEGFRVKPMNVGINQELSTQYEISGTPTFIASNGDRQVGYMDIGPLRNWLASHGAKIK